MKPSTVPSAALAAYVFAAVLPSACSHGEADVGVSSRWYSHSYDRRLGSDLDYTVDGTTYEGYVALPAGAEASPAGVLVAHQWMGLSDYEKSRADELAANGYVAFALDVYGKDVRCEDTTCAQAAMSSALANITKLRGLISAGTTQLLKQGVNASALLAIGYCFGGSMVLELARHPKTGASSGVVYLAVSSVHGSLTPYGGEKASTGAIATHVQAHHAELDFSGDAGLLGLEAELKDGTSDTETRWETLKYGKCSHGWTEPGTPIYRPADALRAHKSTFNFFEEARAGGAVPEPFPALPFCRGPDAAWPASRALLRADPGDSPPPLLVLLAGVAGGLGTAALFASWRTRHAAASERAHLCSAPGAKPPLGPLI